jgi:hypothetical protein
MTGTHHVAVVGMAGRFPGASDIDEFWANLHEGVESIAFPTDGELRAYGVPDELLRHPEYVKAFATTPGVADFDAALFGYTPREAESTDPQIRMSARTPRWSTPATTRPAATPPSASTARPATTATWTCTWATPATRRPPAASRSPP